LDVGLKWLIMLLGVGYYFLDWCWPLVCRPKVVGKLLCQLTLASMVPTGSVLNHDRAVPVRCSCKLCIAVALEPPSIFTAWRYSKSHDCGSCDPSYFCWCESFGYLRSANPVGKAWRPHLAFPVLIIVLIPLIAGSVYLHLGDCALESPSRELSCAHRGDFDHRLPPPYRGLRRLGKFIIIWRYGSSISTIALLDVATAWYVSNVSIIFDAPCLFLHHLPNVSLHFVALLCIFRN
jgi:hypothetical protein